jgi:cysteine-rich repeat protein
LVLLAGSGIACGRTDLTLTATAGANGNPSRRPIADAALPPDLPPLPGPDFAPAVWPDLAPPLGPDLAPDLRKPICGNGWLDPGEDCDDGNSASGDGCSEFCLTEDCWNCTSGVCQPRPSSVDGGSCHGLPGGFCGDGILQGAEECDAGAENSDGAYGGCSTHCRYLVCGDGIVKGAEECDLGTAENTAVYGDHTGCTSACALPHFCGDWYVDAASGEECDNGSLNGQLLCTQYCRIWMP